MNREGSLDREGLRSQHRSGGRWVKVKFGWREVLGRRGERVGNGTMARLTSDRKGRIGRILDGHEGRIRL